MADQTTGIDPDFDFGAWMESLKQWDADPDQLLQSSLVQLDSVQSVPDLEAIASADLATAASLLGVSHEQSSENNFTAESGQPSYNTKLDDPSATPQRQSFWSIQHYPDSTSPPTQCAAPPHPQTTPDFPLRNIIFPSGLSIKWDELSLAFLLDRCRFPQFKIGTWQAQMRDEVQKGKWEWESWANARCQHRNADGSMCGTVFTYPLFKTRTGRIPLVTEDNCPPHCLRENGYRRNKYGNLADEMMKDFAGTIDKCTRYM